ncbi:hypothetical protein EDC04DRAFT_2871608 [Pisolithus marmoratus]|nr:hypothetical protein EDC04DRAFT_2871608 [Pisolithus marmoratus]
MPQDEQSANTCPNCKKTLKSSRGLALHLRLSNYCQLYHRARLQELRVHHDGASQEEEDIIIQDEETPERLQQHFPVREDSPGDVMEDFHDRLFDFHPLDNPNGDHNSVHANIDEVTQQDRWRTTFGGEGASDLGFTPFNSEVDWRFAEWAIKSGLVEKEGLPFTNSRGLLKLIESIPLDSPEDKHMVHYRDPLEAIKALLGDPALAKHIVYKPKCIFTDVTKEKRVYNEMWTGSWWEEMQAKLPEGSCVAPVIIAMDKTQLIQFSGGQQAYPVYLTLGNILHAI